MGEDGNGLSGDFPAHTRWSLVLTVGGDDPEAARKALVQLLKLYLPPMRAHLISQWSLSLHDAEDLLQGFISDRVIEQNLIGRAVRGKGRFRGFLTKSLRNYVANEFRTRMAQKRSPGSTTVSIDEHLDKAKGVDQAERTFELAWARQVLAHALKKMRAERQQSGRMVE